MKLGDDKMSIANSYYIRGRVNKNYERLENALKDIHKAFSYLDPTAAKYLKRKTTYQIQIAKLYQKLKDFGLAEDYYLQALKNSEHLYGEESKETAKLLNSIGTLYGDWGKSKVEEEYYEKVSQIQNIIQNQKEIDL